MSEDGKIRMKYFSENITITDDELDRITKGKWWQFKRRRRHRKLKRWAQKHADLTAKMDEDIKAFMWKGDGEITIQDDTIYLGKPPKN